MYYCPGLSQFIGAHRFLQIRLSRAVDRNSDRPTGYYMSILPNYTRLTAVSAREPALFRESPEARYANPGAPSACSVSLGTGERVLFLVYDAHRV